MCGGNATTDKISRKCSRTSLSQSCVILQYVRLYSAVGSMVGCLEPLDSLRGTRHGLILAFRSGICLREVSPTLFMILESGDNIKMRDENNTFTRANSRKVYVGCNSQRLQWLRIPSTQVCRRELLLSDCDLQSVARIREDQNPGRGQYPFGFDA